MSETGRTQGIRCVKCAFEASHAEVDDAVEERAKRVADAESFKAHTAAGCNGQPRPFLTQ